MSKLRSRISVSRDGYVEELDQSLDHPLGVGGVKLFADLDVRAVQTRAAADAGGARVTRLKYRVVKGAAS